MTEQELLLKLLSIMWAYQCKNDIKSCCMDNTQTALDILRISTKLKVKVVAVIALEHTSFIESFACKINTGHLVLLINDEKIYDPSYEVASYKDAKYFMNYKEYFDYMADFTDKEYNKKVLKDHLKFTDIAKRMNEGEFMIQDRIHYDKQIDFIELVMKK